MSGIRVSHLGKAWGTFQAVGDVSFEVPSGTLTVLLGPSGCGKSTTLRLLAGLERPDSGSIHFDGQEVTHAPPAERGLSMVFQSYALFPHLTVEENILFGLKVRRIGAAERRRRLAHAVELLGLAPNLQRRPSQLSGGQQQRVALGRAIVAEARVCLMDEPLSNLDAQLRNEMRREIRAIQQRLEMTMVYVTHDQIEAMSIADQVILMKDGRIEQVAVPSELYLRPATTFAAGFIGTPPMNLLALADGPGGAVVAGTSRTLLPGVHGAGRKLGLRPEQLFPAPGGPLAARIEAIEYHGADSVAECRAGSERLLVRLEGRAPCRPGDELRLGWDVRDQHLFDAASGRRIDGDPQAESTAVNTDRRMSE